jgi:hypothetical protein
MSDDAQSGPSEDTVGYRKPPASTRFIKGQSGNLKGRPRGKRSALPHDTLLSQPVVIREDGVERRVTAAEAFLLQMAKRGLEGDSRAARQALAAITEARAARGPAAGEGVQAIVVKMVAVGCVEPAARVLGMTVRLDPYRPTARSVIEPWLVQCALDRLGDRRLTIAEQREVLNATRTPRKVKWPGWWSEKPL